eukprot:3880421-Heterocapsa_arctica.AAC.1
MPEVGFMDEEVPEQDFPEGRGPDGRFDWQGGEEEFMDEEVPEQDIPEPQQADVDLGEGQGQHISAEERFAALRSRIISRELAALPPELSAVQATRKRTLEFELD